MGDQLPEIVEHNGILVVRDDKYPGGTKARALHVLFDSRVEYVYASPVQGFAQIALSIAAQKAGKKSVIFCAKRKTRHARTKAAEAYGSRIVEVDFGRINVVRARARSYSQFSGAKLLPFGLDDPVFINALADIARSLNITPNEVWTVAGSGVLTRSLQMAWPEAIFHAVQIGANPKKGRARIHKAPEEFEEPAQIAPPFPSCSNYDAKAWRFIKKHASPGALFWNVAA